MEKETRNAEIQKFSNYLDENKHRGQIISKSAWFSSLDYRKDIQAESHVTISTDGKPEEVYVEIGINKEGDNLASIILSPREAYQLGLLLEDYGRELACKHVDFLISEEKIMDKWLEEDATKAKQEYEAIKPQATE